MWSIGLKILAVTVILSFIGLLYDHYKKPKKAEPKINEFKGRLFPEVNDAGWKVNNKFYFQPYTLENGNVKLSGRDYVIFGDGWANVYLYVNDILIENNKRVNHYYDMIRQPFIDKIKQDKIDRYNEALNTLPKV